MSLRQFISARKFLRSFYAVTDTAVMRWKEFAALFGLHENVFFDPRHKKLTSPVTAILIGAGHRGSIYASYAIKFPDELKIVAVADASPDRRKRIVKAHKIHENNCFNDWKDVFAKLPAADAVIIATPDHLHTNLALAAMSAGYNILLEKPIAPTEEECVSILAKAEETGKIVGVCHVLRYSPYFRELKEVISAGLIGDIISIHHMEPIEHVHMSHSYVRGKWRNSKKATPIILAKSCHDTDIIRWLVDSPVHDVHCFGNLRWFTNKKCS